MIMIGSFLLNYNFQSSVKACEKSAMSKSAMHVSPESEKDIYFGQGHMRCLPNGNFDPMQVMDDDVSNLTSMGLNFILILEA